MENLLWRKISYIVIGLLFFGVGYLIGYGIGVKTGLEKAVEFGIYLFQEKGIVIGIEPDILTNLIKDFEKYKFIIEN